MKYKNPLFRRSKNTFPLEVLCGHCKTPVLIYEKGGKGNLIKLQEHRIIESEIDLNKHQGHLHCPNCREDLANRGVYNGRLTFFIIRGKVNSRRLDNYPF